MKGSVLARREGRRTSASRPDGEPDSTRLPTADTSAPTSSAPDRCAAAPGTPRDVNHVFVLLGRTAPGSTQTGDVGELAPNEQIFSVRFVESPRLRRHVPPGRPALRRRPRRHRLDRQCPRGAQDPGLQRVHAPARREPPPHDRPRRRRRRAGTQGLQLQIFDVTDGANPSCSSTSTRTPATPGVHGSQRGRIPPQGLHLLRRQGTSSPSRTTRPQSGMRPSMRSALFENCSRVDFTSGTSKLRASMRPSCGRTRELLRQPPAIRPVRRGIFSRLRLRHLVWRRRRLEGHEQPRKSPPAIIALPAPTGERRLQPDLLLDRLPLSLSLSLSLSRCVSPPTIRRRLEQKVAALPRLPRFHDRCSSLVRFPAGRGRLSDSVCAITCTRKKPVGSTPNDETAQPRWIDQRCSDPSTQPPYARRTRNGQTLARNEDSLALALAGSDTSAPAQYCMLFGIATQQARRGSADASATTAEHGASCRSRRDGGYYALAREAIVRVTITTGPAPTQATRSTKAYRDCAARGLPFKNLNRRGARGRRGGTAFECAGRLPLGHSSPGHFDCALTSTAARGTATRRDPGAYPPRLT